MDSETDNLIGHPAGDRKSAFKGFIIILYENKKLPWRSDKKNLIFRVVLMVYFIINFVVSFVPFVTQDHNPYSVSYMTFSFIGFLFVCAAMYLDHTAIQRTNEEMQDYNSKQVIISVIANYLISSMGMLLIYPILICVMYGFINERAWQFNNEKTGYSFLMLVYSVIMDALYMKFFMIFLVIRIICASYESVEPTDNEEECDCDKKHFTPVYLSIVFAIATAVTHWLMIGIIAVRIYVDNFTVRVNDTISIQDDTGDYWTTRSTRYAIACAIFLPIFSWLTYVIINKLWFYEIYSAIYQMQLDAGRGDERATWHVKLLGSFYDPVAYVVSWILYASFLTFVLIPYYYDFDWHKVASSVRLTMHILEGCFIILFLLTNLQAAAKVLLVIFVIIKILICLAGGLVTMCAKRCFKLLSPPTEA